MKYALLFSAIANYLSFLFATRGIFLSFNEVHTLQFRFLILNTITLWLAGTLLIWNATPHMGYVFITAIQVLCFVGFWITSRIAKRNHFTAVYSKDVPVKLVRSGLYKYVRHPFYLIYLTTYASLILVEPSAVYMALVFSMTLVYIHAAQAEEAKFQSSELSDEHRRYQEETGMFFPKTIRPGTTRTF